MPGLNTRIDRHPQMNFKLKGDSETGTISRPKQEKPSTSAPRGAHNSDLPVQIDKVTMQYMETAYDICWKIRGAPQGNKNQSGPPFGVKATNQFLDMVPDAKTLSKSAYRKDNVDKKQDKTNEFSDKAISTAKTGTGPCVDMNLTAAEMFRAEHPEASLSIAKRPNGHVSIIIYNPKAGEHIEMDCWTILPYVHTLSIQQIREKISMVVPLPKTAKRTPDFFSKLSPIPESEILAKSPLPPGKGLMENVLKSVQNGTLERPWNRLYGEADPQRSYRVGDGPSKCFNQVSAQYWEEMQAKQRMIDAMPPKTLQAWKEMGYNPAGNDGV